LSIIALGPLNEYPAFSEEESLLITFGLAGAFK
jgi:hypothetical protein